MEIILIFVVLIAIFGLIVSTRILVNKGRLNKAKKLAESGDKKKAVELFLKSLKFQLGDDKALHTLDHILGLYRTAGYSGAELDKIKSAYSTLHNDFKEGLQEIEKRKLKDKKKMNAISDLDKEYKEKFDKEFVSILPML